MNNMRECAAEGKLIVSHVVYGDAEWKSVDCGDFRCRSRTGNPEDEFCPDHRRMIEAARRGEKVGKS